MPHPARPSTPVALSKNARIVLEKRYLVKDATGNPPSSRRICSGAWRRWWPRRTGDTGRVKARRRRWRRSSTAHDGAAVRAQLAHAHERRPAAGAALGVLRAAGGRRALQRPERASTTRCGRWRWSTSRAAAPGFSFSRLRPKGSTWCAPPRASRRGPVSFMKLYDASHRRGEAGRHAPRREHGDPPRGSPGHPGLHRLQGRPHADHELQHLGGGHRRVHGGGARRTASTTSSIRVTQARSWASSTRAMVWNKMIDGRVEHGRAGRVLHRRGQPLQPGAAPRRVRGDEPVRRAAAAPVRRLQPRLDQRRLLRAATARSTGTRSARDIHLVDALPRQHHRRQQVPAARDRRARQADPPDRPRRHGLRRRARAPRHPVRLRRGRGARPQGRWSSWTTRRRRRASGWPTERGAFPEWARSIWGPDADVRARCRRASASAPCSCCATATSPPWRPPAPSPSSPGCSSGLEPLFAVAFMRNQAGVLMPDVNEDFVAIAKREGWYSDELMERSRRTGTSASPRCRSKWQRVFVTANHITPEWHIRMQAAFQEHCDSAISKTTQLRAHRHARTTSRRSTGWRTSSTARASPSIATARATTRCSPPAPREHGEGRARGRRASSSASWPSCTATLAETDAEIERLEDAPVRAGGGEPAAPRRSASRPEKLRSTTIRKETPLGMMFVHITEDDKGQPFEVFMTSARRAARDGGRRGDGPADLAGAALRHPDHGDPPPAPRHQLRSRGRPRAATRCSRCPTRSASPSRSGCRTSRACSRSCSATRLPA